eukprot:Phypoly_transcript_02938.p1 GENE.Phypoly_transcript_02938~~Phypoly_transcript_02938.p1  ORF type:complete len:814 (+),score=92.26 Phypoly_transcript_02938:147-2588(+)
MGLLFQDHLGNVLKQVFPNVKIFTNARKGAAPQNAQTGRYLEIDFDIPELSLCFEFQDQYHYANTDFSQIPLEVVQDKDNIKCELIRESVKTLIQVPYWWDGTDLSLVASVCFFRPDLSELTNSDFFLIPLNPHMSTTVFTVPDFGEVMLASFPTSLELFMSSFDSESSWWVGEKYDGVRCVWNTVHSKLYTRRGSYIDIPERMASICAKTGVLMDAELWCGRGKYMETFKIVNSSILCWDHVRVNSFDCPTDGPFEFRYATLLETIACDNPFITVVSRMLCGNPQQSSYVLQQLTNHNAEGAICRMPGSLYEKGRSTSLIKLKVAREDMEAIVVDAIGETCVLKLPNGVKFKAQHPEFKLHGGAVVTIEHDGFSEFGVPLRPRISRIRTDLSWKDVIHDAEQRFTKVQSQLQKSPIRYWTRNKGENMRKYFVALAHSLNLDPLLPSSWYPMSRKQFTQDKNGQEIMRHFANDHVKALLWTFPDLGLERAKFISPTTRRWSAKKRRAIFERCAKINSFDPLIAANWYSIERDSLLHAEGVSPLVEIYYGGKLRNALSHLFPEIGFDHATFMKTQRIRKHRKELTGMATSIGFDPLVQEPWYSLTAATIRTYPVVRTLLNLHYGGDLPSALTAVFPNIPYDGSKFITQDYWSIVREFFAIFASESNFDPRIAANWYHIDPEMLYSRPRAKFVMSHYKGSFPKTLMHAFPDIGLNEAYFANVPHFFWKNEQRRRDFLAQFARNNDFDPLVPDNWYSLSLASILQDKATRSMINQSYNGKLGTALAHLFPDIGFSISKFKELHSTSRSATMTRLLL